MSGDYSQTPYGDFWTDSGKTFFDETRQNSWKRPQAGKLILFGGNYIKKTLIATT